MEQIQIIDFNKLKKTTKGKKKKVAEKKKEKPEEKKDETSDQKTTATEQIDHQQQPQLQQQQIEQEQTEETFISPYTYEFLLDRIQESLKQNNPKLAEKSKVTIKLPQITKISGKRTAWLNFVDICKGLKRQPDHICAFFLTELGTEGSVTGEQMILKGRYFAKHIEQLIKKYIGEYVCCPLCKSPNTELKKDQNSRLYMMNCLACQSTRSVASIKQGISVVKQGERKKAAYMNK